MVTIEVPASKVWTFFYMNRSKLMHSMAQIASNDETKYALYITDDRGYPTFLVFHGDDKEPEYEEGAIGPADCEKTVQRCISKYLIPVTVETKGQEPEPPETEPQEDEGEEGLSGEISESEANLACYDRGKELVDAFMEFLKVVLMEYDTNSAIKEYYGEYEIEEALDFTLEGLAQEYGLPVYRPMIIEDNDAGVDCFIEYPYNPELDAEQDEVIVRYEKTDKK